MDQVSGFFSILGSYALTNLLPAIIFAVLGILAIQLVNKIVGAALEKSKMKKAAHTLIKSVLQVVLYLLLGLIVASRLGIDVTGVIALASVLTLAVSLALQNALANIIGGFTLLYTDPFNTGDFVEIAGQSGTVKEVGLTYTRLATADNKEVSIPNSAVIAAQIVNFTVAGTRRVDITVSASYNAPVEKVLACLEEAAAVPQALYEPIPFAAVKEYADSSIVYVLQVWCKSEDYWATFFGVNKRVKEVFDAKGIEMTYPHLNVHVDKA